MASFKSLVGSIALVLVIIAVATKTQIARAQSCNADVSDLQVCAPFVLPGVVGASPSRECCGAVQSVQKDCLCNALRVAATLPSLCNLPPLGCNIST